MLTVNTFALGNHRLGTGLRRLLPISGPLAFSAANFIAALVVQQTAAAADFGLYAFIQILIGTGMGLSDALFGTPLVIAMAKAGEGQNRVARSFAVANLCGCVIAAVIMAAFLVHAEAGSPLSAIAAINGMLMLVRWHLRAQALARNSRVVVVASDMIYCFSMLAGMVIFYLGHGLSIHAAVTAQLAACSISMLILPRVLGEGIVHRRQSALFLMSPFLHSFKDHGGWSLTGSVATNLVANFHAYYLTLVMGAASFAPIALATILFRPLGVILTGLIHSERPKAALWIHEGRKLALDRQIAFIRAATAAVWLANVAAVTALFVFAPTTLNRGEYPADAFIWAIPLVAMLTGIRAMREPKSSALQAGGAFKAIAGITLCTAPLTMSGVIAAAVVAPDFPALVLVGAAVGEAVNFLLVERQYRMFSQRFPPGGSFNHD